ncbi:quinone oxidoreductase [Aspergillus pseudocaelatus]|uniref:Quinone oxidoreductase n=1 Tax=Aspergillus pseudocaelatus TaxID=1825620 RepID=A0ABQ6WYG4_9EURO|nr:quinone oxidoreductase [Aspergillus pseudocaelatus]
MRAVGIQGSKGPATSLFIEEVPTPAPKRNEVLVRVKAFGLNRMDISQREGRYPVPPQAPPILGVEFSGVIHQIGDIDDNDQDLWEVGDEVFGLVYGGAYAEYVAVSRHMLIRKPSDWSWELAAAIPETWMTATQALFDIAHIQPGDRVLWHAGASTVSIAGIQLSIAAGASEVYASVGTDEKVQFTQKLGARRSFNYRTSDWVTGIREATDQAGVDIIIDFIGKDYFTKNLDVAAKDGRVVILGMMSGSTIPGPMEIAPILRKRITISGSTLRGRDLKYQISVKEEMVKRALPGIASRQIQVPIERVFSWKDVSLAHQLMETNSSKGKIVCTIEW